MTCFLSTPRAGLLRPPLHDLIAPVAPSVRVLVQGPQRLIHFFVR